MRNKILNILLLSMFIAGVSFCFNSCKKANDEMLSGVWVLIDIGDIDNTTQIEWRFSESTLSIYQVSKANSTDQVLLGQGSYLLKTRIGSTKLIVIDFPPSLDAYNMEWNVNKMTDTEMVLSGQKDAGLEYKEFSKQE